MPTSSFRVHLVALLIAACDGQAEAPPVGSSPEQAAPVVEPSVEATIAAARLQRSIELEQQGELELARLEADAAVVAGGGRDAVLQAAKLAILGQRYDDAVGPLEGLVKADPNDAVAQYDLALVRHHQGDYNRARSGYLAVLRSDPHYADARYNLAELCSAHGFVEEARHHVAKFRAAFPDDARGPELDRRMGGTGAAGPAGTPGPVGTPVPAPAVAPAP